MLTDNSRWFRPLTSEVNGRNMIRIAVIGDFSCTPRFAFDHRGHLKKRIICENSSNKHVIYCLPWGKFVLCDAKHQNVTSFKRKYFPNSILPKWEKIVIRLGNGVSIMRWSSWKLIPDSLLRCFEMEKILGTNTIKSPVLRMNFQSSWLFLEINKVSIIQNQCL